MNNNSNTKSQPKKPKTKGDRSKKKSSNHKGSRHKPRSSPRKKSANSRKESNATLRPKISPADALSSGLTRAGPNARKESIMNKESNSILKNDSILGVVFENDLNPTEEELKQEVNATERDSIVASKLFSKMNNLFIGDDDGRMSVFQVTSPADQLQSVASVDLESNNSTRPISIADLTDELDSVDHVKSGFLTKEGHFIKNWLIRWFVLRSDGYLFYFKSQRDAAFDSNIAPQGMIELAGSTIEPSIPPPKKGFDHVFAIRNSKGRYFRIMAPSREERKTWVKLIMKCRDSPSKPKQLHQDKARYERALQESKAEGVEFTVPDKLSLRQLLTKHLKFRPAREELTKSGVLIEIKPVFREPLEQIIIMEKRSDSMIPKIVEECITHLEKNDGLKEEGLFRIPGRAAAIQQAQMTIDTGKKLDIASQLPSPHDVAGLLKLYYRELPEPLLTFKMNDKFLQVVNRKGVSDEKRAERLQDLVSRIPEANRMNLVYLIKFLVKVSEFSNVNMMTPSNLAVCWGPGMMRPPPDAPPLARLKQMPKQSKIIELMISNYEIVFKDF